MLYLRFISTWKKEKHKFKNPQIREILQSISHIIFKYNICITNAKGYNTRNRTYFMLFEMAINKMPHYSTICTGDINKVECILNTYYSP